MKFKIGAAIIAIGIIIFFILQALVFCEECGSDRERSDIERDATNAGYELDLKMSKTGAFKSEHQLK